MRSSLGAQEVRALIVEVSPDWRCKVRALHHWDSVPEEALPWAEIRWPLGMRPNEGDTPPVQAGDYVWIDFIGGDTRYPRITGSCDYSPDGVLNAPHEAFSGAGAAILKRATGEPEPCGLGDHPHIRTAHGTTIMVASNGAGKERITILHRATGSHIELSDYSLVHTEGDAYRSSTGDTTEQVKGHLNIAVTGDATVTAENATVEARSLAKLKGNTVRIESDSTMKLTAGGTVTITGPRINLDN